jgi:hypothetical protein
MSNNIIIRKGEGWPIWVDTETIYSDLSDSEFRILCAFMARTPDTEDRFDEFAMGYDSKMVADIVLRYRRGQAEGGDR